MKNIIINAIHNRRVLKLGNGKKVLTVEPHAFGIDRTGNTLLLCYVRSGSGTPFESGAWWQLRIRTALSAIETPERFPKARSGYKRNDTGLIGVFAQI